MRNRVARQPRSTSTPIGQIFSDPALLRIATRKVQNSAPNCRFNADTNIGHGFAIFMAFVGTLRTCGATVSLTWVLGFLPHA